MFHVGVSFSPSFSASDKLWVHQQDSRPNQNEDLSDLSLTKNAHGPEIPFGYTRENSRLEPKNQPFEKGKSFEPKLHLHGFPCSFSRVYSSSSKKLKWLQLLILTRTFWPDHPPRQFHVPPKPAMTRPGSFLPKSLKGRTATSVQTQQFSNTCQVLPSKWPPHWVFFLVKTWPPYFGENQKVTTGRGYSGWWFQFF